MTSRLLLIAVLLGCAEPATRSIGFREVAPTPTTVPHANAARYQMRRQFYDLRLIEQRLIAGKLDDGATLAYALVRANNDPHAAWQIDAKRVTRAAIDLTRATDVDEALRREAAVATECAACHLRTNARVTFAKPPTLPDAPGMAQHGWASERLSEGLIGNDVDRWRRGLAVLADSTVTSTTLQTMARDQLAEAAGPPDPRARAIAYGKILVTCAGCHAKLGAKLP